MIDTILIRTSVNIDHQQQHPQRIKPPAYIVFLNAIETLRFNRFAFFSSLSWIFLRGIGSVRYIIAFLYQVAFKRVLAVLVVSHRVTRHHKKNIGPRAVRNPFLTA